jgi:1-acyl-sn-glycerol-3-phosphate acyltransferase
MLYWIVVWIVKLLAIVFFRIRVYGRENIPKEGGAVLASNHQSYLDPALIAAVINRPVYFLARKELFEVSIFFSWLIRSLNAIPLERRVFDSSGFRQTLNILKEGNLLVVFPEGTRTSDGKIGSVKKGISLLQTKTKVPLIPTLIKGAYENWPRRNKLPIKLASIKVYFNKPIWLERDNFSKLSDYWKELEKGDNYLAE